MFQVQCQHYLEYVSNDNLTDRHYAIQDGMQVAVSCYSNVHSLADETII